MVTNDLSCNDECTTSKETATNHQLTTYKSTIIDPDMAKLAFAFGEYLSGLPSSEACKVVCQKIPEAQDILKRCGKLRGLIAKCPYLSMSGGSHGGTYILILDRDMFASLVSKN